MQANHVPVWILSALPRAPLLAMLVCGCSAAAAPGGAGGASGAVAGSAAPSTQSAPTALATQDAVPTRMPGPPPAEAAETHSGLFTLTLSEGTGATGPRSDDSASIRYTAWAADGSVMKRVEPSARPHRVSMADLPFGWAQGLRMMRVGETRRLWIPAPLGYTDPGDDRAGRLLVDVELVGVHRSAARPRTPRNLAQPPADATRLPSGLAYEIVTGGHGTRNPGPDDLVRLQYTAWTQQGVAFRSSHRRGSERMRPRDLIEGWGQAIQHMVEGQRIRAWIPESLAYRGQAGQPAGTLVFELHLEEILEGEPLR